MVEFAVSIQNIRELSLAHKPWEPFEQQNQIEAEMQTIFFQEWQGLMSEQLKVDRVYFGSEFCQYRLLPLPLVKRALKFCWENELEFTYVSSYVHDEKFEQLIEIANYLQQAATSNSRGIEFVVNDWGVYHYVKNNCPNLHIVIGRLLNKNIRDPRVAKYYNDDRAPENGRNFFQESGLLSSSFRSFLDEGRVVGLEFDELIQGQRLADDSEYTTIFHYPYGCVASGSACMVGFMNEEKKNKYRGNPTCQQQCQSYLFELKNRAITDLDQRMIQKGNTAFFIHDQELVRNGLRNVKDMNHARVVYALRIPV